MICLTRLIAKQLRMALKRTLQLPSNSLQHVVWLETTTHELRAFSSSAHGAVEYHRPGSFQPERLPITLAALAACEGSKGTETVEFTRQSDTQVLARWQDRNVPQSLVMDVGQTEFEPPPSIPSVWAENFPQLATALADAMEVTDESTARYSLNCVQLRASDGRIAATDSSQLLLQHGFNFPWDGEVLVPATSIFKPREFWSGSSIRIGKTADSVVFDTAPWTIWLTTNKEGRFPRVEDIVPAADTATTRMVIEDRDVDFLLNTLPRLPLTESVHRAVTVELNGHVALLARGEDSSPVTRAILSHAHREGDELRWLTNRDYLQRAVQLGFRTVDLRGNEAPALCRDASRVFVWSLLTPSEALEGNGDVIDVVSGDSAIEPSGAASSTAVAMVPATTSVGRVATVAEPTSARPSVPEPTPVAPSPAVVPATDNFASSVRVRTPRTTNRVAATFAAMDAKAEVTEKPTTSSLSSSRTSIAGDAVVRTTSDSTCNITAVLQEAEALKTSLRTAHTNVSRLISALKRQRRQSKLMHNTLASLRQLQTLDV